MQADAIHQGWVRHRRYQPKYHELRFPLVMVQLDLAHLSAHFEHSRWWSLERFNLISFKRADYLHAPGETLEDAVRNLVENRTGERPTGTIQIYTQPRIWGLVFNPVTFYWCFSSAGELQAVVSEINTTPWNERHVYVLPVTDSLSRRAGIYRFRFPKHFHVSPFMPMTLDYDWRFAFRDSQNVVHMTLLDNGKRHFDATLVTSPQPFTKAAMRRLPWQYPLQCLRVVGGIYWHALRLKLKQIPFYPHPPSPSAKKRDDHDRL